MFNEEVYEELRRISNDAKDAMRTLRELQSDTSDLKATAITRKRDEIKDVIREYGSVGARATIDSWKGTNTPTTSA